MTPFRRLVWPGLATLVALAILMSLGVWQLNRRTEKEAQLQALAAALSAVPRPLDGADLVGMSVIAPGAGTANKPGVVSELTRVSLKGTFLADRSVPVRATLPVTKGGATSGIGFFWMTPLQMETGHVVFINRGFVNSGGDWRAPAVSTPQGPQVITGLLRMAEKPRPFTPADNPAKGEYFSRDPEAMAGAVGLPTTNLAGFFIDAERLPGNLTPPVGVDAREMISRIPNNHLQYAVTWFAFAATLIGVFGVFARARLREPA